MLNVLNERVISRVPPRSTSQHHSQFHRSRKWFWPEENLEGVATRGALPRLRGRGEQGNVAAKYLTACCAISLTIETRPKPGGLVPRNQGTDPGLNRRGTEPRPSKYLYNYLAFSPRPSDRSTFPWWRPLRPRKRGGAPLTPKKNGRGERPCPVQ